MNDLDLDRYCSGLQYDLNVLTSRCATEGGEGWGRCEFNKPMWPYSNTGYDGWKSRSLEEIRAALRNKVDHQAEAVADAAWQTNMRVEGQKGEA